MHPRLIDGKTKSTSCRAHQNQASFLIVGTGSQATFLNVDGERFSLIFPFIEQAIIAVDKAMLANCQDVSPR
jgi:hypothetical protein